MDTDDELLKFYTSRVADMARRVNRPDLQNAIVAGQEASPLTAAGGKFHALYSLLKTEGLDAEAAILDEFAAINGHIATGKELEGTLQDCLKVHRVRGAEGLHDRARVRYFLGSWLSRKSRHAESADMLSQAWMELSSLDDSAMPFWSGTLLSILAGEWSALGDEARACSTWRTLREWAAAYRSPLDNDTAVSVYNWALSLARLGRLDEAVAALAPYVELLQTEVGLDDPQRRLERAAFILSRIYGITKDNDRAESAYTLHKLACLRRGAPPLGRPFQRSTEHPN